VDLGQPVHVHIPEEQLAMTESDSEMSDSVQSSSDSYALGHDSEVVNSSDEGDEIAPLPSDADMIHPYRKRAYKIKVHVSTALSYKKKISRYIFIPPATKLGGGVYWNQSVCLSVRLSVCRHKFVPPTPPRFIHGFL
jgi:hypothetical protein